MVRAAWVLAIAVTAGCGSTPRRVPAPQSTTAARDLGACAAPERDGVVSAKPRLNQTEKDLDGDGTAELLVADERMCTPEGNCHWNVFIRTAPECTAFAGTIGAAALEPMETTGDGGYRDIRAWWNLTGGGRLLLEEYRYRRGGYRVIDTLLCRRTDGDRIVCATADR